MLFNKDFERVRQPYFIVWDGEQHNGYETEQYIQVSEDGDISFTSDIDIAYRTYNKEKAFKICEEANKADMGVKVIIINIMYKLWNDELVKN